MIPALTVGTWIELTLKATIVLACATGASVALRRASAATRHLVWAGALAAVLVMPAVRLLVPRIAVAVPMPGVTGIAADPPAAPAAGAAARRRGAFVLRSPSGPRGRPAAVGTDDAD